MIARLRGRIVFSGNQFVILDVGGVGYKVRFSARDLPAKAGKTGNESIIDIWTHLNVREDALELFGFLTHADLAFFEMLIRISGIGPRGALGIMSIGDTDSLKKAISAGDTNYLTKVSGIGKKIADKIILELRDKLMGAGHGIVGEFLAEEREAVEALEAMGYVLKDAQDVVSKIDTKNISTEEIIKKSLKLLGR